MHDLTLINRLQVALEAMAPAPVAVAADRTTDQAEAFEYTEEGQHLVNAVIGRRNEFIVGRRCARAALQQRHVASCALPIDTDGLPVWPIGMLGSISHSRGHCCAAVSSIAAVRCLGVDLEKSNRLTDRAMARIVHPLEADAIGEDQALGSLLFSAKEAFFKAQFPIWRAEPSFKDLALRIDAATGTLQPLEIAAHLPVSLRAACERMQYRYQFIEDYVVTLCWLKQL